jgi:mono/diheme cytochrome c family protein
LKRALLAFGVLLVALVLGSVLVLFALFPRARPPQSVHAEATPEAIARGRYLATTVAHCAACHSPVQDDKPGEPLQGAATFAGRDFGPQAHLPGLVRARNLTPDPETGIGQWSDGEILRAVREGIGKDGRALFPMMPYLAYAEALSEGDALAVVAYLRSLPPVRSDLPRTELSFPVGMFLRTVPRVLRASAPPPSADPKARGSWLLKVANCNGCHDRVDGLRRPIPGKELGGGSKFYGPAGVLYAPNISSDLQFGIGAYSDDELLRAITHGVGKTGQALYVMPWPYYKDLSTEDKTAILAALRSSAPVPADAADAANH